MHARRSANALLLLAALICLSVPSAGCRSQRSESRPYQTIAPDRQRDLELAARENTRALGLMNQQKWDEAERVLKSALSADTLCGPAHNNLGKVYYQQRRYYLAAWEFQYAIQLMPNQPAPRNNLGLVYEAAGKLADAAEQYEHAMELEPDASEYLANLARARLRSGQRDKEVKDLLQRLVLRETRPQWSAWAHEQLVRLGTQASFGSTEPTTSPQRSHAERLDE